MKTHGMGELDEGQALRDGSTSPREITIGFSRLMRAAGVTATIVQRRHVPDSSAFRN